MALQFPEGIICTTCSHYRDSRPHITVGMTVQKITCERLESPVDVQTSCSSFECVKILSRAA